EAGEDVEDGGLAAAGVADDAGQLTLGHGEPQVLEHRELAPTRGPRKAPGQPLHADERPAHPRPAVVAPATAAGTQLPSGRSSPAGGGGDLPLVAHNAPLSAWALSRAVVAAMPAPPGQTRRSPQSGEGKSSIRIGYQPLQARHQLVERHAD